MARGNVKHYPVGWVLASENLIELATNDSMVRRYSERLSVYGFEHNSRKCQTTFFQQKIADC